MVDYHRTGNMEGRLGNATPTTSLHQLHWWKSPRWIVIRIEALAVVAIIISFLLVVFGSCRRWSNSWIVQKGFFAAQVISLSLGTYSIGLMQSSSVKSEMYPVWTVSLFTLFGCIDPITTYNGLDYKGPLSKVVFGICLNCGYVLLMSISTISNVIGNAAIITLSAITFVKGFHRSFALVQQNRMRDMVLYHEDNSIAEEEARTILRKDEQHCITFDIDTAGMYPAVIGESIRNNKNERLRSCYDVCVALRLSHKLQCHLLGLGYSVPRPKTLKGIDFKYALEVIEIELAFVYDAFFTGNPFLDYYQAKAASLWALASFIGICFVLAAAIPGALTRRSAASGFTKVVDTTATDLAITFGIVVSLALLQLTQLVRSWTSNWARAAVACAYAMKDTRTYKMSGWMRMKVFVATSTNLFDKYLWQGMISQYSMLPGTTLWADTEWKCGHIFFAFFYFCLGEEKCIRCVQLVEMLGLHYIRQVIWELFSRDTNKRDGIKLDEDVKGPVIDFLGQIQSDRLDRNWLSSLPEEPEIRYFLPHFDDPKLHAQPEAHCYRYTSCVLTWHIVTWYCEHVEEQIKAEARVGSGCGRETAATCLRKAAAAILRQPGFYFQTQTRGGGEGKGETKKTRDDHRRVANALSQYCVYLVKSAPELLPGPVAWTKRVYNRFAQEVRPRKIIQGGDKDIGIVRIDWYAKDIRDRALTENGEALAKLLLMRRPDEIWKTLALVWVQLLVYAAPYGNVEAHMRHLAQGGEFITHLWALLYHLDIRQWKPQGNLTKISTMEDAERVLADDGQAVIAFLFRDDGSDYDEVATASRLEDGVRYYYASEPDVTGHFRIQHNKVPALVFLKKEGNNKKFPFYDGKFCAYDIARFVTANKIVLPQNQARAQSSENDGGQSQARIEEEIQPLP